MHRITRLLYVAAAILAATALTATSASASTVPSHPAAGVYNISPAHTLGATVLDVAGASTGNAGVGQWKKYGALGALNQRFRIEPYTTTTFGTPVYRILPQHVTNMCLDIAYASPDPGGKLIQHGCNGQENQEFFIQAAAGNSGTYEIIPRHSGLYLEVPGRSFALGTQLDQNTNPDWPASPPDYQDFTLTKVSN